jgi:hypothetical protein
VKRQLTGWEKILVTHALAKGLISRICKEFKPITNKTTTLLKMDKRPE